MSGAAASPFALRGVIEGFYGNPYTQEQRLELVDFLAAHGMNTFVYGPKDDPLVRARWRDPYDGGALHRLAELVDRCRARDVQLMYCVSPGLSMRYSDPDDMDALVAKLASVADLGVDAFGLLLDDIPMELQHAEDRVAFAGPGRSPRGRHPDPREQAGPRSASRRLPDGVLGPRRRDVHRPAGCRDPG